MVRRYRDGSTPAADKVESLATVLEVDQPTMMRALAGELAPGELVTVSVDTSSPARRPSITDLLDDSEAERPIDRLARAGGSIVAKGYDDDGLMYAVEIVFHVRPDARESRHQIGFASGAQDTINNSLASSGAAPAPAPPGASAATSAAA